MSTGPLTQTLQSVMFSRGIKEVADLGMSTLALTLLASLASALLLSWAYSSFYGARASRSIPRRARNAA